VQSDLTMQSTIKQSIFEYTPKSTEKDDDDEIQVNCDKKEKRCLH